MAITKTMNKIKVAIGTVFLPVLAFAQLSITEVMYDPPNGKDLGREWVEIINDSNSDISVSDFRLREAGINHRITAVTEETLAPGQVGVIVQDPQAFRQDNPQFRGLLFIAVFNLRQQGGLGETLSIYNKSEDREVSSVTYIPDPRASGTGGTIHFSESGQIPAPATPGLIATNPFDDTEETSINTEEVIEEQLEEALNPSTTVIQIDPQVLAGVEFSVSIADGPFPITWNFGDGVVKKGASVSYLYNNPGVYRVVVDYGGEIITKILTVSKPLIRVLVEDGIVYIDNGNSIPVKIDNWKVISSEGTFIFPKLSSIERNTRVPISVISTSSPYFILRSPNGVIISEYGFGKDDIVAKQSLESQIVLRDPKLLPWFIALIILILVALFPIILEAYYGRKK